MRPIKLTMSAFGPYAGEISLNLNEITKEGIYLICGETGAGKTMLFDAIAYALFGEASGSSRESAMLRSRFAPPDRLTYVNLEFENNGKMYSVYRELGKEKMKNGVLTEAFTKEAWLKLPDGTVISKSKDVTEAVCGILGMDRERFRRIVMIAQGEFCEFLHAKTKDKMTVLRKIFRTEIFNEFSERAKAECKAERSRTAYIRENAKKTAEQFVLSDDGAAEIFSAIPYAEVSSVEDAICLELQKSEKNLEALEKEREVATAELNYAGYVVNKAKTDKENTERLGEAKAKLYSSEVELALAKEEVEKTGENEELISALTEKINEYKGDIPFYDEKDKLRESLGEREKELTAHQEERSELLEKAERGDGKISALKERIEKHLKLSAEAERTESELESTIRREGELDSMIEDSEEYENLTLKLEIKQKEYSDAASEMQALRQKQTALMTEYFDGIAGVLASSLTDGGACPVCGSLTHPNPAEKRENSVSRDELDEARASCDKAAERMENLAVNVGELRAKSGEIIKNLREKSRISDFEKIKVHIESERSRVMETRAGLEAWLGEYRESSEEYNDICTSLKELEGEIGILEDRKKENDAAILKLEAVIEENRRRYDSLCEKYSFHGKKELEEEIARLGGEIDKKKLEIANAKERASMAELQRNSFASAVETIESLLAESVADELPKYEELYTECEKRLRNVSDLLSEEKTRLERNKAAGESLLSIYSELGESEKRLSSLEAISDTANGTVNGKDKIKLEIFWQMRLFDRIIRRANLRLMQMTDGRYELIRRTDASDQKEKSGLELDIIDRWNGRSRSVKTLSGGETFTASLALALALSDETEAETGGVKIDTMFIDEGFGSLDEDALCSAIAVLEKQAVGRSIGIISHVQSLRDRLDRQIIVSKKTGESTVTVRC